MADAVLPGFRFYPTEDELVGFYLKHKIAKNREDEIQRIIPVVDIYCYDPWQLPGLVGATRFTDDDEFFFFVPRDEKETQRGRPNRTTSSGYWKATGSPGFVYSSKKQQVIGVKKSLVFYTGKAPTSKKTKWKMNEYKALSTNDQLDHSMPGVVSEVRSEFSLCRLYVKTRCMRAFDRRPLFPSEEEMASKELKMCSYKGSSSNFEENQEAGKEKQIHDDPIDWETISDLDPSLVPWSSI